MRRQIQRVEPDFTTAPRPAADDTYEGLVWTAGRHPAVYLSLTVLGYVVALLVISAIALAVARVATR
jgi:hypothetical protein